MLNMQHVTCQGPVDSHQRPCVHSSAAMFATADLAAAIDRAEGRLCAGIAEHLRRVEPQHGSVCLSIGGGVAVLAGVGAPTNKMIGVGFDGPPSEDELTHVERVFSEQGAALQAEISTLADPAWHATLVARGYVPQGFENVLGHGLASVAAPTADVQVSAIEPDGRDAWVEMIATSFQHPDVGGVGGDSVPPADELRRWMSLTTHVSGFEFVAARLDGNVAGGASFRIDGRVAQLAGAATLPAFRRRGVQTALLRWRLARARALGCESAVVVTQPASKSQANAQREGFALLYARQILVKAP
jgi:GNAT superfamily N-acetyltransferase